MAVWNVPKLEDFYYTPGSCQADKAIQKPPW